ncbi:MAG: response regulator [Chloroflexota bacterium]
MTNNVVLVVDDDSDLRQLYATMFEAVGMSVRCVASQAEAVVFGRRPGCVVLDWELPDGCGRDVARALHRRWGVSLPIILVTGAPLRAEDVADTDVTRFVAKPFEMDEVIEAVRHAVNHRRVRRRTVSFPSSSLSRAG